MIPLDTSVHDCSVVVVDPEHERFGQIADLTAHDLEYDALHLKFPDGHRENVDAGWMKDEFAIPQGRIMLRNQPGRILNLQRRLPAIKAELLALKGAVKNEQLPVNVRQSAKKTFWVTVDTARSAAAPAAG